MEFSSIIREKDLKEKLALQCFHSVMKYARQKERKVKHKGMRALYRRFILMNKLDYDYAFLFSLLFAADFMKIKERVLHEPNLLEHISYDAYWDDVRHNVGKVEAVFFSYTYFDEKYPEMRKVFEEINLKVETDPSTNMIDLVIDYMDTRKQRNIEEQL